MKNVWTHSHPQFMQFYETFQQFFDKEVPPDNLVILISPNQTFHNPLSSIIIELFIKSLKTSGKKRKNLSNSKTSRFFYICLTFILN